MLLINTVPELKTHLAGVWLNTKLDMFLVLLEQATDRYIIPAIGQPMYDELVAQPFASLPLEYQKLHKKMARALAYYTLYEGLPGMEVAIGDFGAVSHKTENREAVNKRQSQSMLKDTAAKADYWLEHALQFLEKNQLNYKVWETSEAYSESQGLFLRSAIELTEYYPAAQNRRSVYLRVRPFVKNCEEKYLRHEISAGLYAYLKKLISTPFNLPFSDNDNTLLRYVRLYVASIAMYEAHYTLSTELTEHGYRTLFANDSGTHQQNQAASETQLNAFRDRAWADAQSHRRELRTWLDTNASLSLFPDYFGSTLYPVAGVKTTYSLPDNANRKSFRF